MQMVKELRESGVISLLTDASVTAVAFATLIYSLDPKPPLQPVHNHAVATSRLCVWFLRELERVYPSARAALDFLLACIEN
jgi:hypothetical protein